MEKNLINLVRKHNFWVFAAGAFVASLALRWVLLPCYSSDINQFLLPWYEEIVAGGGLASLANHSANYNTAYMLLLVLATKLPMEPINAIKLFSLLGDYLLATAVGLIVYRRYAQNFHKAVLAFLFTTLLPLTIFNSAYWGQCDAIYVGFLVFAVYFFLTDRWLVGFVFVGLSLAFKLQAIFILPALLILYVMRKKFSALYFLIPPVILFLSGLPAVAAGADLFHPFGVYFGQVEDSGWVFVNYFNLSLFFPNHNFELIGKFLVIAAVFVCFALLLYALHKKLEFREDNLILLAAWSTVCCVLFLPGMHERYGYAGEIFLWVWFFCQPSRRRFVPFIVFYTIGFMANSRFLFGTWPERSPFIGLLNLINFCWLTYILIRDAAPKPEFAGVRRDAVSAEPSVQKKAYSDQEAFAPFGAGTGMKAQAATVPGAGNAPAAVENTGMAGEAQHPLGGM